MQQALAGEIGEEPAVEVSRQVQDICDDGANDIQELLEAEGEGEQGLEQVDDVLADDHHAFLDEGKHLLDEVDGGAFGLHNEVQQEHRDHDEDDSADDAGLAIPEVLEHRGKMVQRFAQGDDAIFCLFEKTLGLFLLSRTLLGNAIFGLAGGELLSIHNFYTSLWRMDVMCLPPTRVIRTGDLLRNC